MDYSWTYRTLVCCFYYTVWVFLCAFLVFVVFSPPLFAVYIFTTMCWLCDFLLLEPWFSVYLINNTVLYIYVFYMYSTCVYSVEFLCFL